MYMKLACYAALALAALPVGAQKVYDLGFENIEQFKPDYYNTGFVNPSGDVKLDASGAAAHSGKAAVQLNATGAIIIELKDLKPGQNYRLTAWAKGSGNGNMQIEWLGAKQNDYKTLKLSDKYQRMIIDATAPAGANRVYLKFLPDRPNGNMWLDDITLEERTVAKDAPLLDFEIPLTGPGNVGKYYVNPVGEFSYDDSGKNAKNGIGALKLGVKGRITVAYTGAVAGKTYEFSAFMKGKGTGGIQMQWLGTLAKPQLDTKIMELSADYQLLKVRAVAPQGSNGMIYLHIFTGGDATAPEIWVDDVRMDEVKVPAADAPAVSAVFTGGHERFCIYNPGEPVVIRITGNDRITAPDKLEWRLCNYRNEPLQSGSIEVTPPLLKTGVDLKLAPQSSGAFFLYLKLAKSGATIPVKGSRPGGFVCFGVLPALQPLALASPEDSRFGAQGTNFISSGEFMKGPSLTPFYTTVGLRWCYLGGMKLNELESAPGQYKAKTADYYRSQPAPETALLKMAEVVALEGAPQYMLKLPSGFAKNTKLSGMGFQSHPLADPTGYERLFGEAVKDRAARSSVFFPDARHNYYQIHWEPDWHWQGTEDDFLEYYRLASTAIRQNDPKGMLLGANYGVISSGNDKMESLFKKGLGNYLGGVLTHLYFLPVKNEPEMAGLPRDCRRLRRLTDQYIRPGAPLMNTEWGVDYRGQDTAMVGHPEWMNQLARFTRGHLIALGEGFNATWFFYTTDYCSYSSTGGEQGYGISFNTSGYIDKHLFGAASIEPKPAMMAAAAMTRLLEGTQTLGRLDHLPPELYAYSFRRADRNLLAVWSPNRPATLKIPVGVAAVTVYDVMGNPRTVNCPDEILELPVDLFPQYVTGIADRVLPTAPRRADSIFAKAFAIVTPGASLQPLLRRNFSGRFELRRFDRSQPLTGTALPETMAVTGYELAAVDQAGKTVEAMLLEVTSPLHIATVQPRLDDRKQLTLAVTVENRSEQTHQVTLNGRFNSSKFISLPVSLTARSSQIINLSAADITATAQTPGQLRLELVNDAGVQTADERRFAVSPALPVAITPTLDGKPEWAKDLWSRSYGHDAVTYQAKRHRGDRDFSVRYALGADAAKLYIAVEVRDDVACASTDLKKPWLGDAVMIALGSDFDGREEFKSCRFYAFRRMADGSVLAQQVFGTPPQDASPLAAGTIPCAIRRDDATQTTVYEIAVPRPLPGIGNKPAGLGISVYDADSEAEVKEDVHRDLPLAGGVPLFMGNKTFSTLLFNP